MKRNLQDNPILIVYPPYYKFMEHGLHCLPLGPAYIFSVLKQNRYNVEFCNLDYKRNLVDEQLSFTARERKFKKNINNPDNMFYLDFKRYLRTKKPIAILINFHSSNLYHAIMNIVMMIKEIDSEIKIIVGGMHPTVFPVETIKEVCVDIVVRGEGEKTIIELIQSLEKGSDLQRIKGITYIDNGNVYSTADREFIADLDRLPYPTQYMKYDKKQYNSNYYGTIMISRGCPAACRFCATQSMWKGNIRFRTPRNVIEEIRFIQNRFKTREFTFLDDAFTLNRNFVEEFCSLIRKERLNIIWTCLTRADLVDKNILKDMKSAGCYYILLGVETGDQGILDAMDKKSNLEVVMENTRMIQKEGILTRAFFMLGYPNETMESLRNSQNLLRKIKPDSGIIFFTVPLPGSELYRDSDVRHHTWDDYNINFPGTIKLGGLNKADLLSAQRSMFTYLNKRRYIIIAKLLANPRYIYNRFLENIFDFPKSAAYLRRIAEAVLGISKVR